MRYLVTGGAGFIGGHVVERLIAEANEVVILDDLTTGDVKNIKNFIARKEVKFINGSILNSRDLDSALENVERVIHLAAAVGVFNIVRFPFQSLKTNVIGTMNVLERVSERNIPILLTSSSEVYGKNSAEQLSEESDRVIGAPQKLRWSYSDSKAIDEAMALSLHRELNLEVRIVRLFNTVGPGQVGTYGMVLPRFVQAALANNKLEIYGSGAQTRCFLHVVDAVDAILRVEKSLNTIGTPLNIGNSEEISILSLAHLVIKTLDSKSSIEFLDYPYSERGIYEDMERRVPDLTKIKDLIGWSPKKSLEDAITDIASFFKTN